MEKGTQHDFDDDDDDDDDDLCDVCWVFLPANGKERIEWKYFLAQIALPFLTRSMAVQLTIYTGK